MCKYGTYRQIKHHFTGFATKLMLIQSCTLDQQWIMIDLSVDLRMHFYQSAPV